MRGTEFLDKMEFIDPAYIEAADKAKKSALPWVKWGAMVACLCLVIAGVLTIPKVSKEPQPAIPNPNGTIERDDNPIEFPPTVIVPGFVLDEPIALDSLFFNEATAHLSGSRAYISGYFTEKLTEKELSAIVPKMQHPDMDFSAVAGFDGNGALLEIFLTITEPTWDDPVLVTLRNSAPFQQYMLQEPPSVSTVHEKDYTIYQWSPDGDKYILSASAEVDDWFMQIEHKAFTQTLRKDKTDFAMVLLCFSEYSPDFSAVVADHIPEYFDEELSLHDAYKDANFGAFMVQEVPEGFTAEAIRRYKDQNYDYLSGLWGKGLSHLYWNVSFYNQEDTARFTSVAQIENYDLSLYPIPRAESVPENLREIVDNPIFDANELTLEAVYKRAYKVKEAGDTEGWRMAFSVKYGDVLVEIRAKDVEPQWVYEQCMRLLEK
ncbi:MAG: hypothetical protein J6K84_00640 [Oscillospiraceae bacterium]|nr:hypothetical protein [Oscillospiraceae bacterium]